MATVLGTVKSKEDVAEFYKRYFHDFIREVHLATHAESGQEYKVSNRCLMKNNCYYMYKSINIAFFVGVALLEGALVLNCVGESFPMKQWWKGNGKEGKCRASLCTGNEKEVGEGVLECEKVRIMKHDGG